jgi:hypothetical protein
MSINQGHIWKKLEDETPKKKISKKFLKKKISIKSVDKESIANNECNTIKNEKCKMPMFTKKKKGRKMKESNEYGSHDKFSNDNLKRKLKTHFHNYIIALLNNELQKNPKKERIIRFGKIKASVTQNITIGYNRKLFEKKIKDIVVEVSNKYQNSQVNSECINYIMNNQKENEVLIKYLNMTYKDMYINYYLKSTKESFADAEVDESYESHKEKLKKLFGEHYLKKYIKNAENLINFYNTRKQRKSRKIKEDSFDGSISKHTNPKTNINNIHLYYSDNAESNINLKDEEIDKMISDKNKVSTGVQTDAKFTNDEDD